MATLKMLRRNNSLIWSYLDDEIILVDHKTGYLHELNATGAFIWGMLESYKTKDELIETLYNEFSSDVDLDVLRTEVEEFILQLITKNVIEEVDI